MEAGNAVSLIPKYHGNDVIKTFLCRNYIDNILMSDEFGSIDFSPAVKNM